MWNAKLALVAALPKALDRDVAIDRQFVEISYLKFRKLPCGKEGCVNNVEMLPLYLHVWISIYLLKSAQKKRKHYQLLS